MSFRRTFWRFAHRRYQMRQPSVVWEVLGFGTAAFFSCIYAIAFLKDFEGQIRTAPGLILFVILPLTFAVAHRRIRLERKKGSDALYRKMLATNG